MSSSTPTVRRGFTLIELLIVVVIVGILAAIAIPKFSETKGKSYATSMKTDLKNLAGQQEIFFHGNERYAANLAEVSITGSPGVSLSILQASSSGWSAVATHPAAAPMTCAVFYGGVAPVAPAVNEGVVHCE